MPQFEVSLYLTIVTLMERSLTEFGCGMIPSLIRNGCDRWFRSDTTGIRFLDHPALSIREIRMLLSEMNHLQFSSVIPAVILARLPSRSL